MALPNALNPLQRDAAQRPPDPTDHLTQGHAAQVSADCGSSLTAAGSPGVGTVEPAGRLNRTSRPQRSAQLHAVTLEDLSGELLARIAEGAFASEMAVTLGCQLSDALASALDIHINRTSRQYYQTFGMLPMQVGLDLLQLKGATVVDVGCGSINPYGVVFLYLMLGAQRGVAIDLDPVQDEGRAVKALANCAAMMLLNASHLVGDYPIQRAEILQHVASFDLARLQAGDPAGIDHSRLLHRLEAVGHLSLDDGEADLVLSNSFLEHVDNVEAVIADLARITRIGGVGIHRIDGADHRRYGDPGRHPLDFLTEVSDDVMVGGCNRLRPLDFVPVFERHGFEVLAVTPLEVIDVAAALQQRLAAPFCSLPREVLGVVCAQFVVRRQAGQVRRVGVSPAVLAVGWSRLSTMKHHVNLAWSLIRQQRHAEALELLRQVPPEHPEYAQCVAFAGRVCFWRGDREGAERELARALALPSPAPEAFLHRAWIRLEQGRDVEGLADALQARQLIPPGGALETDLHGLLGLLYARRGQHAEAMVLLDGLAQRQPGQAFVHVWRGWALHLAGKTAEARAAAAAAFACDSHSSDAQRLLEALKAPGDAPSVILAWNLIRQQRHAEALELLRQVPPEHPEYAQCVAFAGRVCFWRGDHEGAERELAQALALPSPAPEAFLHRAWIRLEQGRCAEGVADALQARQLIPPGGALETEQCGVLALLCARQGEHAEAMALLDRLAQRQPEQAVVHVWRGWAFFLAGKTAEARAAADAALACDPHSSEVQRLLEALKAPGDSPRISST